MLSLHSSYKQTRKSTTDYRFNPRTIVTVPSFGLKPTSRLKDFTFKFITVPAKWMKTARQFVLNIYTEQNAYATVFKSDFG